MLDEDVLKKKFWELYNKELKKKKEEFISRKPINCKFNERIHIEGCGKVGFCNNKEILEKINKGVVKCNYEDFCKKCTKFQCKNTEESVEDEFLKILGDLSRCNNEYPKIAILLWTLEGNVERQEKKKTWWQKIWN